MDDEYHNTFANRARFLIDTALGRRRTKLTERKAYIPSRKRGRGLLASEDQAPLQGTVCYTRLFVLAFTHNRHPFVVHPMSTPS